MPSTRARTARRTIFALRVFGKAGTNTIILDSFDEDEYPAALDHLAFSLSLYTAQMCTALAKLELLESFTMQVTDAPEINLSGMVRVAEPKLRALAPARLKALVDKGFMGLIYAHLHSLENFSRLLARRNLRRGSGRG